MYLTPTVSPTVPRYILKPMDEIFAPSTPLDIQYLADDCPDKHCRDCGHQNCILRSVSSTLPKGMEWGVKCESCKKTHVADCTFDGGGGGGGGGSSAVSNTSQLSAGSRGDVPVWVSGDPAWV